MDESKSYINAKIVLQKVERRTRLLKAANSSGSPQRLVIWTIFTLFLFGYCWIYTGETSVRDVIAILIPILGILCGMIQLEACIVNKRIDALIELLEIDKMAQISKEE